jgi:hypothetical protein
VAAPATVSGEFARIEPLERGCKSRRPGRQRAAVTREPGDLPAMKVASGYTGRGEPVPWGQVIRDRTPVRSDGREPGHK